MDDLVVEGEAHEQLLQLVLAYLRVVDEDGELDPLRGALNARPMYCARI